MAPLPPLSEHHAIYTRVSTKHQDTASQEPELRRWAESREGDSTWYHDSDTGTSMDRPGFRLLVKKIGQTAARLRGVRWGGSSPGRRIKVTAEQIASIHNLRSDGQTIAGIARATGLTRPTVYRLLGDCHG